MLIVRTTEGEGGAVKIKATSDGLSSAEATVNSRP
jgi:hypothetical protein